LRGGRTLSVSSLLSYNFDLKFTNVIYISKLEMKMKLIHLPSLSLFPSIYLAIYPMHIAIVVHSKLISGFWACFI
jgi:hypothetical protein